MAEYIKRDRVVAIIVETAVVRKMRQLYAYNNGWMDALLLAKSRILEEIPAADVRPERHGHWERVSNDDQNEGCYFCSECKEEYFNPSDDENLLPNFCPNCGAKMDGKDGDTN